MQPHYSIQCWVFFLYIYFYWRTFTFKYFCVAVQHLFISILRTLFSMSCKTGLMVINSLSFCLLGKVFIFFIFQGQFCQIQHFWLTVCFQHFKHTIPLTSGLHQGFYKESVHGLTRVALYMRSHFFNCCFQNSLFVFNC